MPQTLAKVALVVADYDEALDFYVNTLGFECTEDTPLSESKRWVTVRPPGRRGPSLLLARAASEEQRAYVGRQSGGRVFLFVETDDVRRDVALYQARGVRFARALQTQPWGTVAVIEDLYGNLIDLIEPAADRRAPDLGIVDYHAHIYFDAATASVARALRTRIGERFDVVLGNWNERPVGPHPTWSAEIVFPTCELGALLPWLALNRGGLSVLVHPNTADEVADHRDHALWLGEAVALDLAALT